MLLRPCLTLAMAWFVMGSAAVGAAAPTSAAETMLKAYVLAWDHADARALGAQFAPDGDFINPTGYYARGPAAIAAFYRAAFAGGYAGSQGGFTVKSIRALTPDAVAVDGLWSIDGAHDPSGTVRTPERGLATAVIVRRGGTWRIALLREQSSAASLEIPNAP